MISHGHNAFQCNVMHANQGPVKAFLSKSHVQTAPESHDLDIDFASLNSQVPRRLFEVDAIRPSVQTSPEGPGKC